MGFEQGFEGDVSPSWGAYEGAGPLGRSVVATRHVSEGM